MAGSSVPGWPEGKTARRGATWKESPTWPDAGGADRDRYRRELRRGRLWTSVTLVRPIGVW